MSNASSPIRILKPALAAVLMLATTAALAQTAGERAQERRARSDESGKQRSAKVEKQYPDATRKEPDAKASSRMAPKLEKLFGAYDENDVAKAQPIADEIIADEKANAYDKSISARIIGSMLLADDPAKATDYLQKALQFDGLNNNEHYETMSIVAQLQMQEDRNDEGLATLERLLTETNSQKPDLLVLKGQALYRLERYAEAIPVLKAAIDASPEPQPQWQQLLMGAYAESGQGAEATALAEEIAAKTPDDKTSQLNLAATYLQNEQYDKAAQVYQRLRAAGQLTEDRDYRNLFAILLGSENKEQEAIAVINEGLEKGVLQPDHKTYVALAQAYYFSQRPVQAIEAYQKAAPLAPDGETYLNLAKVLSNEGRTAEAKQAAQQALDKGVKSPDDAKRIIARAGN